MFREGIIAKLGLSLGAFALLSLVTGFTMYNLLERFNQGLSSILEEARPLDVAANEMEIQGLQYGNAVKGFLRFPDSAHLDMTENAIDKFKKFHGMYTKLAVTDAQRVIAQEVDVIFSKFSRKGDNLLELQTAYLAQHNSFITSLNELGEETIKAASLDDAKISGSFQNNAKQMRLLSAIWAQTSQALGLLDKMEANPLGIAIDIFDQPGSEVEAGSLFEQEIVKLDTLLQDYSQNWPQESKSKWLDELVRRFSGKSAMGLNMIDNRKMIGSELLQFIAYGDQLNDILDDRIQTNSEAGLHMLYEELKQAITTAYGLLFGWMPALGLVIAGLLVFILRSVVRPVMQLSNAAASISEGDFSHRVQETQKDELGRLGQAFNIMAGRLQTAYENLSRSNAELDAKVAERTQELNTANTRLNGELESRKQTEAELREAIQAANAANEAKTLFLGNMSHELRTPLNAIIGFSDIIMGELFGPVTNEKYIDYAKDINESGAHLLRLINELLDISRIESGHLKLSEENLDLAASIEESLHMLEKQAMARDVILSDEIAPDLPFIRGDRTRIKQIFINLAGNAIKFTPPQGSVRVTAETMPDGGILVKITDTGIGIAPEDITKILEPFGQVANSLARAHEGAGLGLPLAKLLTERHDGSLQIESRPDQGTTITLRFPASRTIPGHTRAASGGMAQALGR